MKVATEQLLTNAAETLNAAELLVEQGYLRDAASRAYYGMFYIAEALLNEKGLSFKKHGAVHSTFALEFIKTGVFETKYHRWLLEAFNQRQLGDYDEAVQFQSDEIHGTIQQAREFLEAVKLHLENQSP
jgi:uncharacterized protein (UPF0332 family)